MNSSDAKWQAASHAAIAEILIEIATKEGIELALSQYEITALNEAERRIREMGYVCPDGTDAPEEGAE